VCGGGRYDGLIEELGGPPTCGIGFGMGVERLLMVQDLERAAPPAPRLYDAFVCTLGRDARLKGLSLVADLRKAGLSADLDHAARSLKAQFKYADKTGAPYVVVLAGDELAKGAAKLRDMAGSSEEEVPFEHLIPTLKERLGRD
jgi:histidyl-tRNA synthetase